MTNEELVRRYYGGDERALEELYRRNLGLIRRIARETAREFNCLHMDRERPGELSGYSISSVWAGTVTMDWFPRSRCFGPFTTAFLHCAAIPAMACSSRHYSFCLGPPEGGGTKSCLWRASSSLWQP